MRSFLFVPGDSERKLAKAEDSAADALVLDLEDAVSADRIEIARKMVREYLHSHRDRTRTQLWVRINPLSTEDRKSTRLNSSHQIISYAVFCLKKKKTHSYTREAITT